MLHFLFQDNNESPASEAKDQLKISDLLLISSV